MNRDDHRAGGRIGSLPDVEGARRQTVRFVLHADQPRPRRATNSSRSLLVITPTGTSPSTIIRAGSPPSSASNASSIGAPEATRANGGSIAVDTEVVTTVGSRYTRSRRVRSWMLPTTPPPAVL